MDSALHPDMVKRLFSKGNLDELSTSQMVASTRRGGGRNVKKIAIRLRLKY